MTDLNFLMVVLGGWGLCDEIGNGEVVQQLWSSFLSILFQQSDCIQNWCYTDTSHSYFHRSSICTGKEGARLNLAGLIRNCLRMFGFLEIGWQQSSASLLIEEQRALWFGSSSGGSAWELGSILRCGSMAAVGEASLSNIPDIWRSISPRYLGGTALSPPAMAKEAENHHFSKIGNRKSVYALRYIGQRGDSSDKPKTSGEALRWVAQFSG